MMGMAVVDVYPVPRIRSTRSGWRVTWATVFNEVWCEDFPTWSKALKFALGEL